MHNDKWRSLHEDELENLPERIEHVKSGFWQKFLPFGLLTTVGCVILATGQTASTVGFGVFLALTGVAGMMALATMCHTQLCLYRMIREVRSLEVRRKASQAGEPVGGVS